MAQLERHDGIIMIRSGKRALYLDLGLESPLLGDPLACFLFAVATAK